MSNESSKKIRVAIVGSGIGGLTMAVALTKLELDDFIEVDVYESTANLTQIGAGIMIWPRSWEILKGFGLEEGLARKMSPGEQVPSSDQLKRVFSLRRSDMEEGHPIVDVMMPGGAVAFHRADVQEVLLDHVSPSTRMHLSHRLIDFAELENGQVELGFKNGARAICDLMIAADGINSVARKILFAKRNGRSEEDAVRLSTPLWTGSTCYRSTLDAEVVRLESPDLRALKGPTMYLGKNKHIVAYPILKGTLVNVVPFISDYSKEGTYVEGPVVTEYSTDDLKSHFSGWEEDVQILIKHIKKSSRWAIQTIAPLDSYISKSGKIVLIGDAAHGGPPHLGNGAGQAIEDVYILVHVLAKSLRGGDLMGIQKTMEVYNAIRQPAGNFIAASSNKFGHMLDLDVPGLENTGGSKLVNTISNLATSIQDLWEFASKSAKPELDKALTML